MPGGSGAPPTWRAPSAVFSGGTAPGPRRRTLSRGPLPQHDREGCLISHPTVSTIRREALSVPVAPGPPGPPPLPTPPSTSPSAAVERRPRWPSRRACTHARTTARARPTGRCVLSRLSVGRLEWGGRGRLAPAPTAHVGHSSAAAPAAAAAGTPPRASPPRLPSLDSPRESPKSPPRRLVTTLTGAQSVASVGCASTSGAVHSGERSWGGGSLVAHGRGPQGPPPHAARRYQRASGSK